MIPELSEKERWRRAVGCVRRKLRDYPGANRLLGGVAESKEEEIVQALSEALLDWNTAPPPLGQVDLRTHPAKHLLILKASALLLEAAGIWHSRERMPSSDGGTSADDHDKAAEYSAWIAGMTNEYERKRDDFKVQQNINQSLGSMGVRSEYGFFYGYGENWAF